MKKKNLIIIVFILLMIVILFTFLFSFSKQKPSLQLLGTSKIVEQINKKYHIPYTNDTNKKKSVLTYQKNGVKKELTDLSEYSILKFYQELGLLTSKQIIDDYLNQFNLSADLVLFLSNEQTSGKAKEIVVKTTQEYNLSYQIIPYGSLEEVTKQLLFDHFNLTNPASIQLVLNKNGLDPVYINQTFTKVELEKKLYQIGFIDKINSSLDETEYFQKIDANQLEKLVTNGNKQIIVIGQTGCTYCVATIPLLKQIATEQKISIFYIDIRENNNQEAPWRSIPSLSRDIGTPYTIIVQNRSILASSSYISTEQEYLMFFQKNHIF